MATSEENSVDHGSVANKEEGSNTFQVAKKRVGEEYEDYALKRRRNTQLELIEPIISEVEAENYATSSAPKKTLHGLTYQLRLLTLFLQRVPDDQEFFLATEMKEAEQFDDIFLKYQENGAWRCKFLQAKHKNDIAYKIRKIDLFQKNINSKINTKSDKPYFLKTYYDSFCKIKENDFFNDVYLDEFLVCTNIGFAQDALPYFKRTKEIDDDPILRNWAFNEQGVNHNTKPIKFKLRKRNYSELKQRLNVNKHDEEKLSQFIEVFRYLVNYEDTELNENIRFGLKQHLRVENTDLAYTYLQNRILKWFEGYQNNQSKYLMIKDKRRFLEELNNNIQSLLVAGYSSFYINELKKYKMEFDNILSVHDILSKKKDISIIITLSTKLSAIKLGQLFNKLKFNQDEIIFVSSDNLQHNSKIVNVFISEPSYQWLVIEVKGGVKVDRNLLFNHIKRVEEKYVVIIGQEDDVLDLNKCSGLNTLCFYDKNITCKDLTNDSQLQLLKKQVKFQNNKVILSQLIDIYLAREIIDALTLESLILDEVEIGNNDALISDSFIEGYYIPRILAQKEIEQHVFQNEELLRKCLFFITGANEYHITKLNIKNDWIFSWQPDITFKNGIVLANKMEPQNIFLDLCKKKIENVCWIKYSDEKFILKSIKNNTGILRKYHICFEEDDLSTQEILKKKIAILVGGPGCGKSIFMTALARQLKNIASDIWILRINLSCYVYNKTKQRNNDYQNIVKSLDDITFRENDTNEAIIFLANILFSQKDKIQHQYFIKELLITSLSCDKMRFSKLPKIILIFDGFDEISPKFKEKTILLLKTLKNSNTTQMWITTRNHEELSLEQALGGSTLFLNPLEKVNKIAFLNKFWLYSLYNLDDRNSVRYTKKIISCLIEIRKNLQYDFDCVKNFSDIRNYSFNDIINKLDFSDVAEININYFGFFSNHKLSDFTDNVLHLKMLAEIMFQNKFIDLGNKELPFLYREFINIKFTICCEEKNAAGNSLLGREIFEEYLKMLQITYQELAFQILFPEYEQEFKEINNKVILEKTGILVINGDRLDFVHRSFAEYFVSEYFANNLQYEYIQNLIFLEVLVHKKYELIRSFLNDNHKFLEKLSNKNEGMINIISKKCFTLELLYQMVWEKTFELLMYYIKALPSNYFEKAVLLNDKCNYGKDILVRVCSDMSLCEDIIKSMLNIVKDSVSAKVFREILFSTDDNLEQTILQFALLQRNSVAKIIIEFVKKNCDSNTFWKLFVQENNMKMTILHIACIQGPEKIDESDYEEILIYLLNLAKYNVTGINEFMLKVDSFGNAALYYAIKNFDNFAMFKVLLNFIKLHCNHETLKTLLLKIDNEKRTLLHTICIEKHEEYLSNFLDEIKDKPDILNELLLKQDDDGQTALHYTIRNYDSPAMLQTILQFITANCNTEIFTTLLLTVDNSECSVLFMACLKIENKGAPEIFNSLLDIIKCNKQVLNELILRTSISGTTILQLILLELEIPSLLEVLLKFVKRNCDLEIFNTLLLKVDNKGRNALHFACGQEHSHNLIYFLSAIEPEIINKLSIKPDNSGLNPVHYCILLFDNPIMLKLLVDFIKINFNLNIVTSPCFTVSTKRQTVLHIACSKNKERKTEYVEILTYLLNQIEDSKINDMLLRTDYEERTILHYILNNSDSISMLKALFSFIKINCSKEIFERFLFLSDANEQHGLHILCKANSNEEILLYLLKIAEENTNPISLKEFLFKKDSYGKIAIDYISRKSGDSSILNVLTNFMQRHSR